MAKRFYGWKPDRRGPSDELFRPMMGIVDLPTLVDLRPNCPPIMNQSALGSCTAHGITGALRFNRIKQGLGDQPLSRLQLYYDERKKEGTIDEDAGAEIRDGIACVKKNGVAAEAVWPYDISKFKVAPPAECYDHKGETRAIIGQRVQVSPYHIKAALASGFPIVIGITVYAGFEGSVATRTGVIPMPEAGEEVVGGHCMYAVGYGQRPGYITVANSWGTEWGDSGFAYIPEAYLGSPELGGDYWIIRKAAG